MRLRHCCYVSIPPTAVVSFVITRGIWNNLYFQSSVSQWVPTDLSKGTTGTLHQTERDGGLELDTGHNTEMSPLLVYYTHRV